MAKMIPLSLVDPAAVEALLDAAFGADRKARTAYRLRDGMAALPALSFAWVDGEALLGTIQCWPIAVLGADDTPFPMVLVGPVAVSPSVQGGGIGKKLVTASLEAAAFACHDVLVMIGDPDYYGRFFNFSAAATGGWDVPGPVERHRLLARIAQGVAVPKAGMLGPNPAFASAGATR
jgi:predicted N-acetyltransferase YhbS